MGGDRGHPLQSDGGRTGDIVFDHGLLGPEGTQATGPGILRAGTTLRTTEWQYALTHHAIRITHENRPCVTIARDRLRACLYERESLNRQSEACLNFA
jgi:hypothetical protein